MKHIGTIWNASLQQYIKIESFSKETQQMVRISVGNESASSSIDLTIDQADHFSDLFQNALPIPNY